MKEIKLVCDAPFFNHVDINVIDYPHGRDGEERNRMKITCDYGKYDVEQLIKRGLDFDGAMDYYRDWIYNTVRIRISQDWECVGGMDEALALIEEKIKQFF